MITRGGGGVTCCDALSSDVDRSSASERELSMVLSSLAAAIQDGERRLVAALSSGTRPELRRPSQSAVRAVSRSRRACRFACPRLARSRRRWLLVGAAAAHPAAALVRASLPPCSTRQSWRRLASRAEAQAAAAARRQRPPTRRVPSAPMKGPQRVSCSERLVSSRAAAPQFAAALATVRSQVAKYRTAAALLDAYELDGWRGAR